MLDHWIIEEILKRQRERDRRPLQPEIEIPYTPPPDKGGEAREESDRGIAIVDYRV